MRFAAVHRDAPRAVYAAREAGAQAVLLSAVGVEADTPFARWRREGEAVAEAAGVTMLRPGLVLGRHVLWRQFAGAGAGGPALRHAGAGGRGTGVQPDPCADLAKVVEACLEAPFEGPAEIGGPERITQAELLGLLRAVDGAGRGAGAAAAPACGAR
jgi:hypothetical protein